MITHIGSIYTYYHKEKYTQITKRCPTKTKYIFTTTIFVMCGKMIFHQNYILKLDSDILMSFLNEILL